MWMMIFKAKMSPMELFKSSIILNGNLNAFICLTNKFMIMERSEKIKLLNFCLIHLHLYAIYVEDSVISEFYCVRECTEI